MKYVVGVEQAVAKGEAVRCGKRDDFFMGKKAVHRALIPHNICSCK